MEDNRTSPTCSFVLHYPEHAALAIAEKREYIKSLIPCFNWTIDIGAGYNTLPPGYVLFDDSQKDHLLGHLLDDTG